MINAHFFTKQVFYFATCLVVNLAEGNEVTLEEVAAWKYACFYP